MERPIDTAVLWWRALMVASVSFFLGVAGHVTAAGRLPAPALLALLFALSVLLSVPMLTRPASTTRLVAMVVGGQAVLHLALSLTAGHTGDVRRASATVTPPGSEGLLPLVGGRRVGSLQDAYAPSGGGEALVPALPVGHLVGELHAHAPMMAVHLAVAAVAGLWLAYGERTLWTLIALARRRVVPRLVVHHPAHVAPRVSPVPVDRRPVPDSDWRTGPQTRRGPPLLAA